MGMEVNLFRSETWLPRPRSEVFPFFADARNLETITPSWLKFRVLTTDPLEMKVGLKIDYRLRARGLPLRWQSEITEWEPPNWFVDEQRRGPYRLWRHEHRFEDMGGGTLCIDMVRWAARGGPFRKLIERLWVRRDIDRIFEYRRKALAERFGLQGRGSLTSKMEPRSGTE